MKTRLFGKNDRCVAIKKDQIYGEPSETNFNFREKVNFKRLSVSAQNILFDTLWY